MSSAQFGQVAEPFGVHAQCLQAWEEGGARTQEEVGPGVEPAGEGADERHQGRGADQAGGGDAFGPEVLYPDRNRDTLERPDRESRERSG